MQGWRNYRRQLRTASPVRRSFGSEAGVARPFLMLIVAAAVLVLGGLVLVGFGAGRWWSERSASTTEAAAEAATNADSGTGDPVPDQPVEFGTVLFVIDGDTVDLEIDGQEERVRLLGIDAPESVHRSVPEQCFGAESSAALSELLPVGSQVRLERDEDPRDRYGRLLLYLYRVEDDLFVNRWLVQNGLADTSFYEPNTARVDELTAARAEARANRVGLWGSCDGPDQPLDLSLIHI